VKANPAHRSKLGKELRATSCAVLEIWKFQLELELAQRCSDSVPNVPSTSGYCLVLRAAVKKRDNNTWNFFFAPRKRIRPLFCSFRVLPEKILLKKTVPSQAGWNYSPNLFNEWKRAIEAHENPWHDQKMRGKDKGLKKRTTTLFSCHHLAF